MNRTRLYSSSGHAVVHINLINCHLSTFILCYYTLRLHCCKDIAVLKQDYACAWSSRPERESRGWTVFRDCLYQPFPGDKCQSSGALNRGIAPSNRRQARHLTGDIPHPTIFTTRWRWNIMREINSAAGRQMAHLLLSRPAAGRDILCDIFVNLPRAAVM